MVCGKRHKYIDIQCCAVEKRRNSEPIYYLVVSLWLAVVGLTIGTLRLEVK